MSAIVHQGDCLDVLRGMADNSVDSIVTDPPYGLSFMGKKWDYDVPSTEIWAECLRVLKPGGHLLAFAGTRTQHRMAVRIEDAGFEIRDMIAWVYGSGFPKSLDVSKAIDKAAGAERTEFVKSTDPRHKSGSATNFLGDKGATGTLGKYPPGFEYSQPATDAARQWQGWGTALKPALEPITVARKPLVGTVAANVLAHGTGALNIDGARVHADDGQNRARPPQTPNAILGGGKGASLTASEHNDSGRWPANLIHDGSPEVLAGFPQAGGAGNYCGNETAPRNSANYMPGQTGPGWGYADAGSAARFFYCPKASGDDRGADNTHPTVKPTDLMAYLCRLVTPPGGTVLDPFNGSGSTGRAAVLEGFSYIGCELDPAHVAISRARIAEAQAMRNAQTLDLFEDLAA